MTTAPTPKESLMLNNAVASIQWKLAWLGAHPGKTRRDWDAGLQDPTAEVWQWLRAQGALEAIERERRRLAETAP